jgi:hypothetical protein
MTTVNLTEQGVKISSFSTAIGVEEFYLTGTSPEGLLLRESLNELAASYRNALIENNLDESTQQFVRIFLSDSSNEEEGLLESEFFAMVRNGSVSVIEQSPIDGGSVGRNAATLSHSSTGVFVQKVKTIRCYGRPDTRATLRRIQKHRRAIFYLPLLHRLPPIR